MDLIHAIQRILCLTLLTIAFIPSTFAQADVGPECAQALTPSSIYREVLAEIITLLEDPEATFVSRDAQKVLAITAHNETTSEFLARGTRSADDWAGVFKQMKPLRDDIPIQRERLDQLLALYRMIHHHDFLDESNIEEFIKRIGNQLESRIDPLDEPDTKLFEAIVRWNQQQSGL